MRINRRMKASKIAKQQCKERASKNSKDFNSS